MADTTIKPNFFTLPAEIRLDILSYIFHQEPNTGFWLYRSSLLPPIGLYINEAYTDPQSRLDILLVCRQFRDDFTRLAFNNTQFVIRDTFTPVPNRLSILQPYQASALKSISFVACAAQFRDMVHWHQYPFNNPNLRLDTLSIVFHRSGHWHYPHEFTTDLVSLLRRLENVKTLKFIRNGANIKGFFRTWFNRLIGLILKEDHRHIYDVADAPKLPVCWWDWNYSEAEQSFELASKEPRPVVPEEDYMEIVKPLIEELMMQMEIEEVDPDPRARNGWA